MRHPRLTRRAACASPCRGHVFLRVTEELRKFENPQLFYASCILQGTCRCGPLPRHGIRVLFFPSLDSPFSVHTVFSSSVSIHSIHLTQGTSHLSTLRVRNVMTVPLNFPLPRILGIDFQSTHIFQTVFTLDRQKII